MDKFVIFLLILVSVGGQDNSQSRLVNTLQGPVRGYRASDGDYYAFYGIPYATEPTGRDKFKAPLPAPTWDDTFEAVDTEIRCPQLVSPDLADSVQRDNCLVAHVHVPDTNQTNLPVVVYVPGGAYVGGDGLEKTAKIMVQLGTFIAVSFNYRLGVHGFLCLGTEQVPGNAGMKDNLALLRWVNANIASFGGNPNDVTISGYSAGSSAVELLMLSPAANGLFHKVIPESGNAASVWSLQLDPMEYSKWFASAMGFESDDVYELEDFFTALSIEEVTSILTRISYFKDSTLRAVPCVERSIFGVESFLTESASSILRRGDYPKVPVLVGFTSHEAIHIMLSTFDQRLIEMNANFTEFIPADLMIPNDEEREEVASQIREFYFGNQPVSDETIYNYLAFNGDISFVHPALRTVKMMAEAGSDQIYLYEYTYYDEAVHSYQVPNSTLMVHGAIHVAQTDELLEPQGVLTDDLISEEQLRVRNTLREYWINFIRTGSPVPEPTEVNPEGWPTASANRSPHMKIDSSPTLLGVPRPEESAFWDNLYERYYRDPIPPPEHPERNSGCNFLGGILTVIFSVAFVFVLHC